MYDLSWLNPTPHAIAVYASRPLSPEAYTAIAWGVGLSHERSDIAGAEGLHSLEGNMCGTAMRGAVALPGSKATSRAKGSHRKLGGLVSGGQVLRERDGPHREGEGP